MAGMEMTPERWDSTTRYLRQVFGVEDDHLTGHASRAHEAGLPSIAVSADVGRLLNLLALTTNENRGPDLALELGTLGGYSGIWIARALTAKGRLLTIEPDQRHADFAASEFAAAGLTEKVTIVREPALQVMPKLVRAYGGASFDFIFFDAIKTEYLRYFALASPMLKPGGLLVADNALGSGGWWIDQAPGESAERDAVDRFNRVLADDPDYDAACVPLREGLLIARKKSSTRGGGA